MATVFTTVGKQWTVDVLDPATRAAAGEARHIAWGTGAGTAAVGDTTLFTETTPTRTSGAVDQSAADTYRVIGTLTADAGKTITNAGVFTAASGGVLFIKADFTGIPLLTGDRIEFTFTLQVT